MASVSNPTPRIFTRGETSQFRVAFFGDEEATQPLIPITPQYPQYTIFNPEGTPLQTGTGTQFEPGNWRINFLVPKDAKLSYFNQQPQTYNDKGQGAPLTADVTRYRIEWTMVTAENFQIQYVEEFDVRDVAVTQSQSRELKYLALAGDAVTILTRTTVIPYNANVRVILRGNDANPVFTASFNSLLPGTVPQSIQVAKDGDSYVLYTVLAGGTLACNTGYVILWQIQETQFETPTTEFQPLVSITPSVLPMITSLRMLIDKFQKRLGRVQAYEDSDLLEYLSRGVNMVNLSYPTTGYTVSNMPDDLLTLALLAAGWWGLKAQAILENDMAFNFSGQSVTLSVDRQAGLDSSAASMMEFFNAQIGPAKYAYTMRAYGVGTAGVRAYSYRSPYMMVQRISSLGSGAASSFLNTFAKLGLL